jgi:hypothetical protein
MLGVIAVEFEAQATVVSAAGSAILPAYTPRSFAGDITVTGVVAHVMRNATSKSGDPIQVFRIDEVIST